MRRWSDTSLNIEDFEVENRASPFASCFLKRKALFCGGYLITVYCGRLAASTIFMVPNAAGLAVSALTLRADFECDVGYTYRARIGAHSHVTSLLSRPTEPARYCFSVFLRSRSPLSVSSAYSDEDAMSRLLAESIFWKD